MTGRGFAAAKLSDIEARGASARCIGCPLGAAHAGRDAYRRSAMIKWSTLCARCGCGNTRIVSGRICISCFNRGTEFLRGRNGRGNAPILATPVRPMAISYSIDGSEVQTLRVSQSADHAELALTVLRTANGPVTFLPAVGEA